jgi:hypothetical protein
MELKECVLFLFLSILTPNAYQSPDIGILARLNKNQSVPQYVSSTLNHRYQISLSHRGFNNGAIQPVSMFRFFAENTLAIKETGEAVVW